MRTALLVAAGLALTGALATSASATPAQICVDVNGQKVCVHSPIDPR